MFDPQLTRQRLRPAHRAIIVVLVAAFLLFSACQTAPPASGSTILFSAEGRIRLISAEGGRIQDLGEGGCPTWSPDGARIAFAAPFSKDIPNDTLYMMSNTGGDRRALIGPEQLGTLKGRMGCPDWIDINTILFYAFEPSGPGGLYTFDVNGGSFRLIFDQPSADIRLSPDSRQIAFTDPYSGDLYVMNADGSNKRTLYHITEEHMFLSGPEWSRDGNRIAATMRNTQGQPRDEVVVIDVNNGALTHLANRPAFDDWNPVWSPDGQRIAFLSATSTLLNIGNLFIIDASGGEPTLLAGDLRDSIGSLIWSPDSRRIAFFTKGSGWVWNLYTVDVAGSRPVKLTDSTFASNQYAPPMEWQP